MLWAQTSIDFLFRSFDRDLPHWFLYKRLIVSLEHFSIQYSLTIKVSAKHLLIWEKKHLFEGNFQKVIFDHLKPFLPLPCIFQALVNFRIIPYWVNYSRATQEQSSAFSIEEYNFEVPFIFYLICLLEALFWELHWYIDKLVGNFRFFRKKFLCNTNTLCSWRIGFALGKYYFSTTTLVRSSYYSSINFSS